VKIEALVKSEFQKWFNEIVREHFNLKSGEVITDEDKIQHSLRLLQNIETQVLPVNTGKFQEEHSTVYWLNIPIVVKLPDERGQR
jgi:hypothetical protein